jgi:hypothetical protein
VKIEHHGSCDTRKLCRCGAQPTADRDRLRPCEQQAHTAKVVEDRTSQLERRGAGQLLAEACDSLFEFVERGAPYARSLEGFSEFLGLASIQHVGDPRDI